MEGTKNGRHNIPDHMFGKIDAEGATYVQPESGFVLS